MEYKYNLPNEGDLKEAILAKLDSFPSDLHDMAASLLSVSSLELQQLDPHAKDILMRDIAIILRVPLSVYKDNEWEITDIENTITETANDVLPRDCGFNIKYTEANPLVGESNNDARDIIKKSLDTTTFNTLGEDLIEKGKKMANAYIILYCLENLLREYIDKMFIQTCGSDYESMNVIPSRAKKKAIDRQESESEHKWLPVRGDKILYYLDFAELADVITMSDNWNNIFKNSFPNQAWITSKIAELYQIRNRIAHNSYLDENTFKALEIYYDQIVRQLGKNKQ